MTRKTEQLNDEGAFFAVVAFGALYLTLLFVLIAVVFMS